MSEASELWNNDPIVVLLTWDMVSMLQHFTGVVGLQPQGVPSPRPACVAFHLAGSHSGGGSMERPRNLWLCLIVKLMWGVDMPAALCGCHPSKEMCPESHQVHRQ